MATITAITRDIRGAGASALPPAWLVLARRRGGHGLGAVQTSAAVGVALPGASGPGAAPGA